MVFDGIYFSAQAGVQTHRKMGVGDVQAVHRGAQHSTAQLDQKKIFRPGFLHSRAERESEGSSTLNGSAWIHTSGHGHLHTSLIHACVYTTLARCKTPHLAQTDQARLTGFFALPDSNTSPKGQKQCLGACGSEPNMHGRCHMPL